MDISGTIASVLWKENNPEQAKPAEKPHESLKDFAVKLVRDERHAREAALKEMRKMLDWRFVHFAEEFRQQLAGLEGGGCAKEQPRPLPGRADLEQRLATPEKNFKTAAEERADCGAADEPRLHLLEGKLAISEHRLAEVQRWTKAFEERVGEEQSRLSEAEAWLSLLDRRVCDTEFLLGGRRGAMANRLTSVERLSVDGRPQRPAPAESHAAFHAGHASRSGGGSSGSGFSGGASSHPMGSVEFPLGGFFGKDRAGTTLPSTKVSTNYATPSSQESLTPSSPSTFRHHGSR